MNRDDVYRVISGIAFLGVLLFGGLAFFQALAISPLWSENGAAWVQAVGSIAAIFCAIWISRDQSRRDLRRRDLDDASNELAACWFLLSLMTQAQNLAASLERAAHETRRGEIEEITQGLDALNRPVEGVLERSRSETTIDAAIDLHWHITRLVTRARRAISDTGVMGITNCQIDAKVMQSGINDKYAEVERHILELRERAQSLKRN